MLRIFVLLFSFTSYAIFRERTEIMKKKATATLPLLLLYALIHSYAEEAFNVQQHLCTKTRYAFVENTNDNVLIPATIPDQCTPIHLNLLARHGTRSPTKKKIKGLNELAARIEVLLRDAKEQKLSVQKVPDWFLEWKSHWLKGDELMREGEEEEYNLGIRIREKFPQLFYEDYRPIVYPIKATQIPRASASAVAFGMGMFSGRGNLGPEHLQAFAVTSKSRACDIVLGFHDCCKNYKTLKKSQGSSVSKLKKPILDEIRNTFRRRYELHFTRHDVSLLWILCKEEASLLNKTDQACALFTPSEVSLLEWTDDLGLFILKGYGNALNYLMGVPLLEDVFQSMEQAIKAKEGLAPGTYEKARMLFAHEETLVPFSCLLGLFLEGSDIDQIQKGNPLELPPKPPHRRNWKGSVVSPFAGNNMLILYSCPDSKYFVQVLHNEHPVPVPGCNNSDICPYEVFKKRVVAPNLKYNYTTLCNSKDEQP